MSSMLRTPSGDVGSTAPPARADRNGTGSHAARSAATNTSTSDHGATGGWVRNRGFSSAEVATWSRVARETTSSCRGSGAPSM